MANSERTATISTTDPIRIGIAGAGRMGQAIATIVASDDEHAVLAGVWTRSPDEVRDRFPGGTHLYEELDAVVRGSDVVIDFSLPEGSALVAAAAGEYTTPLVCGVSGLDADHYALLERAADMVPVVFDRNMSQGVAVLSALVEQAAAALGDEFQVWIDETHHAHKLDAPSGTALELGEAVARARGRHFEDVRWYEPETPAAQAPDDAIRFLVERRGEVPGDHDVRFETATETLRLAHSVTTRDVFARGAVRAAHWVCGQAAGMYGMRDVLGLA